MSTKLERIVWIDQQIRAGRYPNTRNVSEHFELRSPRTVYQDREFMINRLGAPIGYDIEKGGWFYKDSTYILPAIFITEGELLAFFLGQEVFRRYLGTSFEKPIRSALEKISRYLPNHVSVNLQDLQSPYAFTGGATVEVKETLFADLDKAIRSQKRIRMVYYSASSGESRERVVDPYHLHNIRGDWYLIAYCHLRGEVRDFLLSRIEEWEILPETYQKDINFSIQEYLSKGFVAERGEEAVEVVVKFDSYQARWIRDRHWHHTQQIEELEDEGLILKIRVGGLGEIKRWIMGYGSHAKILAPENIKQKILEEAKKLQKIYEIV